MHAPSGQWPVSLGAGAAIATLAGRGLPGCQVKSVEGGLALAPSPHVPPAAAARARGLSLPETPACYSGSRASKSLKARRVAVKRGGVRFCFSSLFLVLLILLIFSVSFPWFFRRFPYFFRLFPFF